MPRRNNHTYQRAVQAHSKVMAARQAMTPAAGAQSRQTAEQEEPMHRYVFPIPQPAQPVPVQGELSAALTQVLEHQVTQDQLLTDLLGAVNALTAALLNQPPRS